MFRSALWNGEAARATDRLLDEFRPDVVHTHKLYPQLSVAPVVVAARRGVPVVQTLHDFEMLGASPIDARGGWWDRDETAVSPQASQLGAAPLHRHVHVGRVASFVAVSRFVQRVHAQRGIESVVIPNFVSALRNSSARFPGFDGAQRRALPRATSAREGGGRRRRARAAAARRPVTIVGTGDLEEWARSGRLRRFPNLAITGFVTDPELASIVAGARVMVVPSRCQDAGPLVPLESMAAGRRSSRTRTVGSGEYVADAGGGRVVPVDVVALADAARARSTTTRSCGRRCRRAAGSRSPSGTRRPSTPRAIERSTSASSTPDDGGRSARIHHPRHGRRRLRRLGARRRPARSRAACPRARLARGRRRQLAAPALGTGRLRVREGRRPRPDGARHRAARRRRGRPSRRDRRRSRVRTGSRPAHGGEPRGVARARRRGARRRRVEDSSSRRRAATTASSRTATRSRPRTGSSGRSRSTPRRRSRPSSTCSPASATGFATTCLRFATVYGASPRMRFDLTVNEFARDAPSPASSSCTASSSGGRTCTSGTRRGPCRRCSSAPASGSAARSSTSATPVRTTASRTSSSCSGRLPDDGRAGGPDEGPARLPRLVREDRGDLGFGADAHRPGWHRRDPRPARSGAIADPFEARYRN